MSAHIKKRETSLLIDTGPLLAFIDKAGSLHQQTVNLLKLLPAVPLLSTWPCLTEAMYLLGKIGGHQLQKALWKFLLSGAVNIHDLTEAEQKRMRDLMARYADTPMDLADASLVAAAEALSLRRLISFDDDFYLYRLADGAMLEVVR